VNGRPSPMAGIAVGLGAAVIVWAVVYLGGARVESQLERGCSDLIEGADLEELVAVLGLPGYRPGCSQESAAAGPGGGLPCQRATVGSVVDFPYLCEGSDCSLYWRVGEVACLVEMDPRTMTVTGSSFMTLAVGTDGV
jgi:hypothetical protein